MWYFNRYILINKEEEEDLHTIKWIYILVSLRDHCSVRLIIEFVVYPRSLANSSINNGLSEKRSYVNIPFVVLEDISIKWCRLKNVTNVDKSFVEFNVKRL